MLLKDGMIGHQVTLCENGFGVGLPDERLVLVEFDPSDRKVSLLKDLQVSLNQSFQVLAAFGAGQELFFQWREHVHLLFELVLSFDIDVASEAAVLLAEKAKTLGLDLGVDFVADIDVRKGHDVFEPWETFDKCEFVVDENSSIFEE